MAIIEVNIKLVVFTCILSCLLTHKCNKSPHSLSDCGEYNLSEKERCCLLTPMKEYSNNKNKTCLYLDIGYKYYRDEDDQIFSVECGEYVKPEINRLLQTNSTSNNTNTTNTTTTTPTTNTNIGTDTVIPVFDPIQTKCGKEKPTKLSHCSDSDLPNDSCCFFKYQTGYYGCFKLGVKFSGKTVYKGMEFFCKSSYINSLVSLISIAALILIF